MTHCVVCDATPQPVRRVRVLGKYDAELLHCPSCEHIRLSDPHWLDEAYSDAIAATDTGLVARNLTLAEQCSRVLTEALPTPGQCVDYAGGTGLFVRLMRDRGFDFRWWDPYCENIHARGFEFDPDADDPVSVVTAFEVIEHLPDPATLIDFTTRVCAEPVLLFSTELHSGQPPGDDWWYYAFDLGQHISFFSMRTLQCLAERYGLNLLSKRGLHMLSAAAINPRRYHRAVKHWTRHFYRVGRVRGSLTQDDHDWILGRLRAGGQAAGKKT